MHREMFEHILRWCAVGLSIAAIVCGVVSVRFGGLDVVPSASLIVVAVVFGLAAYACIAVLGFMEVYSRLRQRHHPIL